MIILNVHQRGEHCKHQRQRPRWRLNEAMEGGIHPRRQQAIKNCLSLKLTNHKTSTASHPPPDLRTLQHSQMHQASCNVILYICANFYIIPKNVIFSVIQHHGVLSHTFCSNNNSFPEYFINRQMPPGFSNRIYSPSFYQTIIHLSHFIIPN